MNYRLKRSVMTLLLSLVLLCSCSGGSSSSQKSSSEASSEASSENGSRDTVPEVLTPSADGTVFDGDDLIAIDASNTSQGYVMARYGGDCSKVKLQVTGPDQVDYTYLMNTDGNYQTFPLSSGNGAYTVRILENVEGDSYALVLSQNYDVTITDEFLPFLYPNQYVDFDEHSDTVAKGAELSKGAEDELDVVENIYHYVIDNIKYDTAKAKNVQYGYLPDVDSVLEEGTGICFDYAAVMCTMLRTQRIPTKLEVGYAGEAYHAWISTYITDVGWVDKIVEFDGESWKLMDPTLGANNSKEAVKKYIGDGSNYTVKFSY